MFENEKKMNILCIFIDAKMYNSDVFQPLKRKNQYIYLGKIRTNM